MRKIVCLIGKTSSGKTTLSKHFIRHFNYQVFEIGDYVRRAYSNIFTDKTLLEFANSYYTEGKLTFFLKSAIEDSLSCKNNILFVGIRTLEEIKYLKSVYPNITIILINCSDENREKRYYKLSIDKDSFQKRNQIENIWMHDLLNFTTPDYVIFNDGTLSELYQQIDDLFLS